MSETNQMHSMADIQGINFMTRRVFDNAAAAVCGMVKNGVDGSVQSSDRVPVALHVLKSHLSSSILYDEIDLHINDDAFIDVVVNELVRFMNQ